jgi:hypothetical protein
VIEISYEQAAAGVFLVLVIAYLFRRWGEVVMRKQLSIEYHNFLSLIRNHCDSNLRILCGAGWDDFRYNMIELLGLEESECRLDCDADVTWKHQLPLLQMILRQLEVMALLSPQVEPYALDELYFDEDKNLRRR